MSLYPENIEQKTGFDQIRVLLAAKCISTMGEGYVQKMRYTSDAKLITKLLKQTDEFVEIISTALVFPTEHYLPIKEYISKANIEGAHLSEHELHELRNMLSTVNRIIHFFKGKEEQFAELYKITEGLHQFNDITHAINTKIDVNGAMKPNASKELEGLYSKISANENLVRKRINSIAKNITENNWGPETTITIRNDRLVVALFPEHKRKIPGIVHDESATGQTLYIEPGEIFELNNYTIELHHEKKKEIRRILIELTSLVMPHVPELSVCCDRLGMFDFIRAKALLSIELKCISPQIHDKPMLKLVNARHPLLYISLKKQKKQAVPLSIELDRDKRIVVISGPNAGGKSVLLKTVGLIQMMFQHGLPVPCKDGSEMGMFKQIYIDIGDQQSIENDLSTYSSHLLNMKHFTTFAHSKTLFLIDEFGTGTDPQLGGPMAEAILEALNRKFAYGIITTHFSNLKILAQHLHGVYNGSMLFDSKELVPLFQFEPGVPGSSYTFEIAQKTGLDKDIIQKAIQKSGNKHNQVEKLIIELEREKTYIKNLKKDLESQMQKSVEKQAKFEEQSNELSKTKSDIISKAKNEALQLLKNANKEIEQTIKLIKENKASNEVTKSARKNLDEMALNLMPEEQDDIKSSSSDLKILIGSKVKMPDSQTIVEVSAIKKNKVEVMMGNIKTWVDMDRLELAPAEEKQSQLHKRHNNGVDLNEKLAHFNAEINVIGKRGEEAMQEVMHFLDEAIMLNFSRVRIVHGRGAGILKRLIRSELKKIRAVKNLQDEAPEFGGDAVTVIDLE